MSYNPEKVRGLMESNNCQRKSSLTLTGAFLMAAPYTVYSMIAECYVNIPFVSDQ